MAGIMILDICPLLIGYGLRQMEDAEKNTAVERVAQ